MIAHAAEFAGGAWLAAVLLIAAGTRSWWPALARPWLSGTASYPLLPDPGLPGSGRPERPAVVSLLTGRLARTGYPATVLDLAARGWLTLAEDATGQLMCSCPARPPADWPPDADWPLGGPPAADWPGGELTAYERRALAHAALRTQPTGTAPAAALGSGFAVGEAEFAAQFEAEVRAEATALGLLTRRLSRGTVAALAMWLTAAAGLGVAALAASSVPGWTAAVAAGYFAGLRLLGGLSGGTRLTGAGRGARAHWRGFRAAQPGSQAWPWPAAGGDRAVGYAAALGTAQDAAAAFRPSGKLAWSSYSGAWREVRIGDPAERLAPGRGALAGVTALLGMFTAMAALITAQWGLRWGALFAAFPGCIWWGSCWYIYHRAARSRRLPAEADFDGQIIRRWTCTEGGGENSPDILHYCVAIDDGLREEAWALSIGQQAYAATRAGMIVRVRVDPRRNRLLALVPGPAGAEQAASPDGPGGSTAARPAPSPPSRRPAAGDSAATG